MAFLSGFYNRVSAAFSQPDQIEDADTDTHHVLHQPSANDNDASSRTISPEEQDDVDTPAKTTTSSISQAPPTPFFAPPATPFGGAPSPVLNQAAADQLRREAEPSQPTPSLKPTATPFFGIFAPPQTPVTRNLSPVRNEAAAQQLKREMLGEVPETPATVQATAKPTPMTQYKTPAMSQATPTEPSTEQSLAADAFQTPSISLAKRQKREHSPIQEESEVIFGDMELEDQASSAAEAEQEGESEASAESSPQQDDDVDESPTEDMDTSTTSVESSDSEKIRTVVVTKSRKTQKRPNLRARSKSYDDRKARIKKSTRPAATGRSVSGREDLLNKARKRFYERKQDGERLL